MSNANISRKSSVSSTDNLEASEYSPQEMNKIFLDAFDEIDTDKSGFISKEELAQVLEKFMGYQISKTDVDLMFKEADINGDELAVYTEFLQKGNYEQILISNMNQKPAIFE